MCVCCLAVFSSIPFHLQVAVAVTAKFTRFSAAGAVAWNPTGTTSPTGNTLVALAGTGDNGAGSTLPGVLMWDWSRLQWWVAITGVQGSFFFWQAMRTATELWAWAL